MNGKPAAVDVPPPTAGAKPVSRSSHAKGLRRRACAYLQRSCHANPIRWLADGFAGSNPTCPARQSVSDARPSVRRGLPFARRLPELYRPAALRTGNTLGFAPATVVSYRGLWRVRDRFCAFWGLNYANNERSSSQPHSPVGRAVHAGRCGSHDRLGHRRRADGSPAASASARITEMMRACRHEGCAAQTSALQRASD